MSLLGNLKMIWSNRKLIKTVSDEFDSIKEAKMKGGWKTSEFWLTAVGSLLNVAGALNGVIDPKTAAIVQTVLTSVYTILRTLAKQPEITTLVKTEVTPPAQ